MSESELIPYRGNCHCGAVVYELKLPEIKKVNQCNCSNCLKKGYLLVYPGAEAEFKILKGEDALTGYRFHTKNVSHKFCSTCATPVFSQVPGAPPGRNLALNVHTIQGLDTRKLEKNPVDGASPGEKYAQPAHKGAMPTAVIEGGQTYTGSCHCGALTVAVVSKPLENNPDVRLVECNCSICERNGYIWVYPENEAVNFYGDEDQIGRYIWGNKMLAKTFCKTCGINMTNECLKLSDEQVAKLPEMAQRAHAYHSKHLPVNVRTLHGVDPLKLVIEQFDGKGKIAGDYIEP